MLVSEFLGHVLANIPIVIFAFDNEGIITFSEGRGLQPDQSDRAFDRFWRADGGGPGSGLGLSIVRAIAERHGGRAFADGALFTIELPAVRDLSESAGTTGGRPPEKGTP
jgi:signal transduction histidine kinase